MRQSLILFLVILTSTSAIAQPNTWVKAGLNGGGGACAFSPDGNTLAILGGAVRLVDVATGNQRSMFAVKYPASVVAFADGGSLVITTGIEDNGEGNAMILAAWDTLGVEQWHHRVSLPGYGSFGGLVVSPDGHWVATAFGLNAGPIAINVVAADSGTAVSGFNVRAPEVVGLCFSPDSRLLAWCTADSTSHGNSIATLWDCSRSLTVFTLRITGRVRALGFVGDGAYVATFSGGEVVVTDTNPPGFVERVLSGRSGSVVSFSHDGSQFSVSNDAGVVELRNTRDGKLTSTIHPVANPPFIATVTFSQGDSVVAVHMDLGVRLYGVAGTYRNVCTAFTHAVDRARCPSQGTRIYSSSALDPMVRAWNTSTGALDEGYFGYPNSAPISAFAVSANGNVLAAANDVGQDSSAISIWTGLPLPSFSISRNFYTGGAPITVLGIPANTNFVYATINGATSAISVSSGNVAWSLPPGNGSLLDVSSDLLALASGSTVNLWGAYNFIFVKSLLLPSATSAIRVGRFSHDGARFAVGDDQGHVIVWDVASGAVVFSDSIRGAMVTDVDLTPDGAHVAAATGKIDIWNIASSRHEATITNPLFRESTLSFSADGTHLAIGADDGSVTMIQSPVRSSVEDVIRLPDRIACSVSPNPVSSVSTISIRLQSRSIVECSVLDVLGRAVCAPAFEMLDGGDNAIALPQAAALAPGAYRCVVRAQGRVASAPFVVVQ